MNAIATTVNLSMADAEVAVRDALAGQGFGILTEVDMAATLKAKLGVDRAPLRILGACNPTLADRALQIDPSASLLLPCNVVLEPSADGGTHIAVADPLEFMAGAELLDLAEDAAAGLRAALDLLAR